MNLDGLASSVKRPFLYALAVSVGVGAVFGALAVLSGGFEYVQLKVILTSGTLALAAVCGLASAVAMDKSGQRVIPIAAIILAVVSAAGILSMIWAGLESEDYWRTVIILSVLAVACTHSALLSLARLEKRFRWSVYAAQAAVFVVALLIVVMLLTESTDMWRVLALAVIADAALSIVVPIFHKLSRT